MLSTNVIFLSTDEENSMKVWDKVTHNGQDRERDPWCHLQSLQTPRQPDSPCAILCPPRSTTDAHVALQQLSHHVPNQVLPPNRGGRKREGRRKGGSWIWMGGPGSWILISFFLFLARKEQLLWSSCILYCPDIWSTLSVLSTSLTIRPFLSFLLLYWWWPTPIFPSWSQDAHWKKMEGGMLAWRCLAIGTVV